MNTKEYSAPTVTVIRLHLESGISVGSAMVKPNEDNSPVQEWDQSPDANKDFEWDWKS